jgi:two-component system sensor histidine kinase UhpB
MKVPLRILVVEDCEDDAVLMLEEMRRGGFEPVFRRVETEKGFLSALEENEWDLILADHSLPQFNSLECLGLLQRSGLDIPLIIVSGSIGEDVAVAAMKSGARDYVAKGKLGRLVPAAQRELREAKLRRMQRRSMEDLRRLGWIVESSDDAIIGKTLEGTITSWNGGAERLFGYNREEAIGQPVTLLVPPERRDEETKILERIRLGGTIEHFETVRVCKDGRRIDVSVSISPIRDGEGRITGASKIARDITARKRVEAELRASREQLRALAAHIQSVREEERKRIARELHDELGQSLTGFKMDLVWIRNRVQAGLAAEDTQPVLEKFASMGRLLDGMAVLMRKICTELRPGVLDDLGLAAAIEWQTREYQARTGIRCELKMEMGEVEVDPERSTALFRILQELLTNVARHARASHVTVLVRAAPGQLIMEVKDDGRGIKDSEQTGRKSLGLVGLRERAHVFGGTVEIGGSPGAGTTATVTMPLGKPEPEAEAVIGP